MQARVEEMSFGDRAHLQLSSAGEGPAFLSTLPAGRLDRQFAWSLVVISTAVFIACAPFAKTRLPEVWPFLPVYQSALAICDLVTAVLLFAQFGFVRSRGLLLLGGAYVFSALMALAHLLSFPGLFGPSGALGGNGQTTAWLYFLWHAAFPAAVIGYALADSPDRRAPPGGVRREIVASVAGAVSAAAVFVLLTTVGHDVLPAIMQGNRDAPAKVVVATASWALCLVALPVLWRRRPQSVLDLWLTVVMCVWVFDVALASVLNAGRFDLGWYAGRVYGLAAGSFVLVVLLVQNGNLYLQMLRAHEAERVQRARAESAAADAKLAHARLEGAIARHIERLRILGEIDRAIVAEVDPDAIAAAVIQPLRRLLDVPRAIVNRFDLDQGEAEWIAAAGRHRTHEGPGVRYSIALMGDIEGLRRGEPQLIDTDALAAGPEKTALLASGVRLYTVVPMIAGGQLIGAVSFGGESREFPQEQVAAAQEVATQLAIAINQARLLRSLKEHANALEQRVQERTAELEAVNRELESFSYSVSHDLRAPLRAVDGYARMLEEDHAPRLDDEGRRLLGVVRSSSQQMGRLIDDLLAFSRLGRQPVAKATVDMTALARAALDEQRAEHPGAQVDLEELPAAQGDPALLKQVWANLIGNALKYSGTQPRPRVAVSGRVNGSGCEYAVRDNGVGFDMKYADKLFRVFQRLHRSEDFHGTGVGLAIVHRVVGRHGGRAWAEGAPGEGACFHFSLPREGG